ncbi:MAG: glycoside hydrolase family 65 protein [Armatimonadetes bacterium]|nr:MAG: glycoside hydrolase family 65 protein [Armatimonadota bacterium]
MASEKGDEQAKSKRTRRRLSLAALSCLTLAGCLIAMTGPGCSSKGSSKQASAAPKPQAPADPWVLATLDPSDPTPAYLSNGLVGLRIGRNGFGWYGEGGDTGFLLADEYESEGEEKILPVDNPLNFGITVEGKNVGPAPGQPYRQQLDMRVGLLTTAYRTKAGVEVSVETALHPTLRMAATRVTLKNLKGLAGSILLSLTSKGVSEAARDPLNALWRLGPSGTQCWVGQSLSGSSQVEPMFVRAGTRVNFSEAEKEVVYELTASVAASQRYPGLMSARGYGIRLADGWGAPTPPLGFEEVRAAAAAHWQEAWTTDIVIDGPVDDQQAVRSFLFYLRSSLSPNAPLAPGPFGLSNAAYNGHAFWDADVWVFPALAWVDPEAAAQVAAQRASMALQARANFLSKRSWGAAFRSRAEKPVPRSLSPLQYPWESSASGLEVSPTETKQQHHITGTVAFGLALAGALGIAEPQEVDQIIAGARDFYLWRAEEQGSECEIRSVVSPDEFHTGDNDLYTNLVAQWCVNGGSWEAPPGSPKFKLPRDDKGFLTYDGDPLRSYKQAAAVLAIFPLQYPGAEAEARTMLERFEDKITPNGPAMSESVHATIWARLGEGDRAYEAWQKSWRRFTGNPLLLFSEKPRTPKTYFLTGAGGCLQTVVHGFLGIRIDSQRDPKASWSAPIKMNKWISARPHLPSAWRSVEFKGLRLLGRRYDLVATHEGISVQEVK